MNGPEGRGAAEIAIAATETLHQGWMRVRRVTVLLSDGVRLTREVEDHGEAACVLPYDAGRKTALLVRQFRLPPFLVDRTAATLEAIAGIVEIGSSEACARREAQEEAGVRLGDLEKVATAWSTPGMSTERVHLFLARYRREDRVGAGGGLDSEAERITVVEMPLVELAAAAAAGGIDDLKTLALVQALMLRHPELFGGHNL